jgi:hypothetical protein
MCICIAKGKTARHGARLREAADGILVYACMYVWKIFDHLRMLLWHICVFVLNLDISLLILAWKDILLYMQPSIADVARGIQTTYTIRIYNI